jgi:hypothetical protein
MKCICRKERQVRIKGKAIWFSEGQIADFEECPKYFDPIEDTTYKIDFSTAKEAELLEGNFDLKELKAFIKDTYGKKSGNRGLEKTVELLLDCRYREV